MPKSPENDYQYRQPGPQLELPAELLPVPTDGAMPKADRTGPRIEELVKESPFQPPQSVRRQIEIQQVYDDSEFDRIDRQAQTTDFQTREKSGTLTPEDEDALAARSARRVLAQNPRRKPQRSRRGLGPRQQLQADEPPPWVDDARRTY